MRRKRALALLQIAGCAVFSTLAGAGAARGAASPWAVDGPSRLRLVSPYLEAPAAGEIRLGLEFRTAPGWHVYWKNSGDAGYAPSVRWSGGGLAPGPPPELLWPAPRRFELAGGLVAFGYEGEVIYPLRARLAAAAGAVASLTAEVDYLVCQVDCIPFRRRLTLDQPIARGAPLADPATAPAIAAWWDRLPAPIAAVAGSSAELRYDDAGPALELALHGVAGDPRSADVFLEAQELFDTSRPQARPLADGIAFRVPLARQQVNRPLPASAPFAWTATGLRGSRGPLALEGRSVVALSPPASAPPSAPRSRGHALLAALAAGLLLTLAPGPLAILLAAAAAGPEHRRGGAAFLATSAGLVTGVASVAVAARAGAFAGWGTALGAPAWTAALAALALLLALDLWGMFEAPAAAPAADGSQAPLGRAVLEGIAVPLLALAWPLPRALAVDLASRPASGAVLLATAVAVGLALPYAALAALPPRDGRGGNDAGAAGDFGDAGARSAWRQALGFLAAAGALWLLYRFSREVLSEGLAAVEVALLALALLAWMRRRARRSRLRWMIALGLAACALGVPFIASGSRVDGGRGADPSFNDPRVPATAAAAPGGNS